MSKVRKHSYNLPCLMLRYHDLTNIGNQFDALGTRLPVNDSNIQPTH